MNPPNTANGRLKIDPDLIRRQAARAMATGTIKRDDPATRIISKLRNIPENQYGRIEHFIDTLNQPETDFTDENRAKMRQFLDTGIANDMSLINVALKVEITPIMSPLAIRNVLRKALTSMTQAERDDIPSVIIEMVNEIMRVPEPKLKQKVAEYQIIRNDDGGVSITPPEPASEWFLKLLKSAKFMLWMSQHGAMWVGEFHRTARHTVTEENGIKEVIDWQRSNSPTDFGVVVFRHLSSWSDSQIMTILNDWLSVKVKLVHKPKNKSPRSLTVNQDRCLKSIRGGHCTVSEISKATGIVAAAVFSSMRSLAKAGVLSETKTSTGIKFSIV